MTILTVPRSLAFALAVLLLGCSLAFASWYERSCHRELLRLESEWRSAQRRADTGQDGYDHVIYASLSGGMGENVSR